VGSPRGFLSQIKSMGWQGLIRDFSLGWERPPLESGCLNPASSGRGSRILSFFLAGSRTVSSAPPRHCPTDRAPLPLRVVQVLPLLRIPILVLIPEQKQSLSINMH
jgi:hypothetical protein